MRLLERIFLKCKDASFFNSRFKGLDLAGAEIAKRDVAAFKLRSVWSQVLGCWSKLRRAHWRVLFGA